MTEENKKENNKEEENETDLVPDWSNIDATSFYRSGGGTEQKKDPKDFEKLTKETNWFLIFIVVSLLVIGVFGYLTKTK